MSQQINPILSGILNHPPTIDQIKERMAKIILGDLMGTSEEPPTAVKIDILTEIRNTKTKLEEAMGIPSHLMMHSERCVEKPDWAQTLDDVRQVELSMREVQAKLLATLSTTAEEVRLPISDTLFGFKVKPVLATLFTAQPKRVVKRKRWHFRRGYAKRVQKKWNLRFGYTDPSDSFYVDQINGTIYAHPRAFERLRSAEDMRRSALPVV